VFLCINCSLRKMLHVLLFVNDLDRYFKDFWCSQDNDFGLYMLPVAYTLEIQFAITFLCYALCRGNVVKLARYAVILVLGQGLDTSCPWSWSRDPSSWSWVTCPWGHVRELLPLLDTLITCVAWCLLSLKWSRWLCRRPCFSADVVQTERCQQVS